MLSRISGYMSSVPMIKFTSPAQILTNVQKVALPLIACFALDFSKVLAGPVTYGACLTACTAAGSVATGGAFIPFVIASCARYCAPSLLIGP